MPTEAVGRLRGAAAAVRRERDLRRRIFTPPPKLTVSEWADKHRMLTSLASAEPGRWRTDRAPYQRGIMDAFSDPTIERVVVMSSAQVGKTEAVLNVVGYFMDQDPAPMLVLQPTLDMARAFSKDRLREMIRATPTLKRFSRDSRRREADETILHRQFPGGHITMVGANSAAGLASRPIRVVLNDEVDRFPASAGSEGDPVSLAKKRTATFWNRKEGLFSTPTIKGASRIEAAFEEGDQRRYYVPCPHCQHPQVLRWAQVDFESAGYVCESCAAVIEERQKLGMLAAGQWIAAKPGGRVASFHLSALYSPWTTWAEVIAEFKDSKAHPDRLRVFINTMLGETWELDGEGVDGDELAARRETYPAEVPAGVGVLTAGVDVQRDRIEVAIKGWGRGQESWLVAHHRIYGDPARDETWERLDAILTRSYRHEHGTPLAIQCACIDSGDGETVQHVYRYVKPRQRRGVYATKGLSVRDRPILNRPAKANKYGVRVVPIGTEVAKDLVFARLRLTIPDGGVAPPGYMHFPAPGQDGGDDEYLLQFGAEKVFIRHVKGVPVREYRRVRARNEAIDLEVLNVAALHLLGAGVYDQLGLWVEKAQAAGRPTAEAPPEPSAFAQRLAPRTTPRPRGGGYVQGWRR
jgi:phage terminase large subunit GpA-like protein